MASNCFFSYSCWLIIYLVGEQVAAEEHDQTVDSDHNFAEALVTTLIESPSSPPKLHHGRKEDESAVVADMYLAEARSPESTFSIPPAVPAMDLAELGSAQSTFPIALAVIDRDLAEEDVCQCIFSTAPAVPDLNLAVARHEFGMHATTAYPLLPPNLPPSPPQVFGGLGHQPVPPPPNEGSTLGEVSYQCPSSSEFLSQGESGTLIRTSNSLADIVSKVSMKIREIEEGLNKLVQDITTDVLLL